MFWIGNDTKSMTLCGGDIFSLCGWHRVLVRKQCRYPALDKWTLVGGRRHRHRLRHRHWHPQFVSFFVNVSIFIQRDLISFSVFIFFFVALLEFVVFGILVVVGNWLLVFLDGFVADGFGFYLFFFFGKCESS